MLVTGGNSEIGFAIANALAKCGVHVTIACRNAERVEKKMKENAASIISITTGCRYVISLICS